MLNEYSSHIRLFSQENRGQSASLNRAWQAAEGAVLGYLSADDRLEPRAVGELLDVLSRSPGCVMVYPDYWLIDLVGRQLKRTYAPPFSFEDALFNCNCPTGPGALFHRSVLGKVGGWDPRLRQIPDWEFILRASLCGEILHHARPLAHFRVHEASQTFQAPRLRRTEEYDLALMTFFARDGLPTDLARHKHRAFASAMIHNARLHLLRCAWGDSWQCIKAASARWPGWPTKYRNIKLLGSGLWGLPRIRARNAVLGWLWQAKERMHGR